MQGRFTREELVTGGAKLMKTMLTEGMVEFVEIPTLTNQIIYCIEQAEHQSQEAWDAVPDNATAEQLILILYLINTDLASGTDILDQVMARQKERLEAGDGMVNLSLDDIVGFQA